MSKDEYIVDSYDQEDNGKWYATILHLCNQKPIAVFRVPSDPPIYFAQPQSKEGSDEI